MALYLDGANDGTTAVLNGVPCPRHGWLRVAESPLPTMEALQRVQVTNASRDTIEIERVFLYATWQDGFDGFALPPASPTFAIHAAEV